MAANKFATMLHRNTHRITLLLVYAFLEWILLILLLLNSLFSYLIAKFADYFGLKPPCLLCSRVDHLFQPTKGQNFHRDLVCETHAREISKLGFCMRHRKLAEAEDMCEDCSSSQLNDHGNSTDSAMNIALFSWVREMGYISSDNNKKIENGEKNSRCACCDVSLSSKLYSPCLLFKPSWGVLDYIHEEHLISAATISDNSAGENSDLCKSDHQTGHSDDEHDKEKNQEEKVRVEEEHQMLFDVDECSQREEEGESVSNIGCKDVDGTENETADTVRIKNREPLEEGDSNVSIEGSDAHLSSTDESMIQDCNREDASLEILHLHLENYADRNDHRFVTVELIDSMTAEDQKMPRCIQKEQENHGHYGELLEFELDHDDHRLISIELIDSMTSEDQKMSRFIQEDQEELLEFELDFKTQVESAVDMGSILGETEAILPAGESENITKSTKLEAMEINENEDSSNIHDKKYEGDIFNPMCEQAAIAQMTKSQFNNEADNKSSEAAVKFWNVSPASGEDSFKMWETNSDIFIGVEMPGHESIDQALTHELCPPLPCIPEDTPTSDTSPGDTILATLMEDNDHGSNQVEEGTNTSVEMIEEGIKHHLSFCSDPNEVEHEKTPETPFFLEGLHHLHKKLLLFEKKEAATTEESFDGSVISELEVGEGVMTVEHLKSALKAEHKALGALYTELEEERSASAVSANQTMAMITKLQEEKAAMKMEALQYQRMMEEQAEYDQEALQLLNELMVKREKEKQELEKELEIYRKKVLDYEAKEKRTRRKDRCGGSRSLSASSSNAEDSEPSVDLNHEGRDEDNFYTHQESSTKHNTPADDVANLEEMGLDSTKHLSTLDESLADFEEERISILEQLKALEEKLFTLTDDDEPFIEHIKVTEDFFKENEGFDQSYDFSSRINGVVNGYCEDSNGIHHEEGRLIGAKAKRLLPLFDEIGMETENGIIHEGQEGSESGALLNFSISKGELENKKLAIEEEVDHVYERLQALEADREFLKHCINSLKKGDKGLDLLQEILQHLRDLRSVELRVRNMSDGAPS